MTRENNRLTVNSKIKDAIKVIESTSERIAVVLDGNDKVLGVLTDGDIRRAILNGFNISDCITTAMNDKPVTARVDDISSTYDRLLSLNNIRSILLLDLDDRFVKTYSKTGCLDDNLNVSKSKIDTFGFAVIMAGGEGTRLRPITNTLPKPMVQINGTPLIERQIEKLKKAGVLKIYISINYLGDVIRDYFGDGDRLGVKIHYLNENKKLGTAGALSFITDIENSTNFLVINGDILTSSNFLNLYHFHVDQKAKVTIGAINHHIRIPYGVISHKGSKVIELREKPLENYFCNAGIYALSSDILSLIPKDTFWNMTDLINKCLEREDFVSVFPLHEYWSDVGTPSDLDKARVNAKNLNL